MKIAIWYHTCLTYNQDHGRAIIADQMNSLRSSGLLDVAIQFNVGLNGTSADAGLLRELLPPSAVIFTNDPELWPAGEVATMREMAAWSYAYPDFYVLYIHMKGLSFPPGNDAYHHRLDWRTRMEDVVIRRWRECTARLDAGYDSVGQWWNKAFNGEYWAGNEFWVTARFLTTLPYLDIKDQNQGGRYEAEVWIGRGPKLPNVAVL